jgi:hypothetical protein
MPTDIYAALEAKLGRPPSDRERRQFNELMAESLETSLLEDLANADSVEYFWNGPYLKGRPTEVWRALFGQLPAAEIIAFAKQVQALWNPETDKARKQTTLKEWARAVEEFPLPGEPQEGLRSLPLQLFYAVLRMRERHFAYCSNPDCKRPFLSKRSTQKYCGRADCAVYASRHYTLNYWHRRGSRLRARRKRPKSSRRGKR